MRGKSFIGAYRKGWNDQKAGKRDGECPYKNSCGSYGAGYRNAWYDGWKAAYRGWENEYPVSEDKAVRAIKEATK